MPPGERPVQIQVITQCGSSDSETKASQKPTWSLHINTLHCIVINAHCAAWSLELLTLESLEVFAMSSGCTPACGKSLVVVHCYTWIAVNTRSIKAALSKEPQQTNRFFFIQDQKKLKHQHKKCKIKGNVEINNRFIKVKIMLHLLERCSQAD